MTQLTKLRSYMKEKGIDAFLCLDELNQRYLSRFAFTDGYLFITEASAYLVTDFRYYELAGQVADGAFEILMPKDRTAWLTSVIEKEGIRTVGLEGRSVSYATFTAYREKYPTVEFVDVGGAVEALRQIKTPEELSKIQRAQDITDRAFSHILTMLTPGMTECEVAVELEYAMRKNGADGFAFDTIAVSGDASALPHGVPRNVKLKSGFLTMDFGAKLDGYCSDMTRTVVIGRADMELRRHYETVLSAQTAALECLRAGISGAEADRAARDIIDAAYPGSFGHSLGHSVGLFIHESPSLSPKATEVVLSAGNVVTVEPGIYLPGKYGCRIEDMVAITEDGITNFTHSTKELIEIF